MDELSRFGAESTNCPTGRRGKAALWGGVFAQRLFKPFEAAMAMGKSAGIEALPE